MSQKAWKAKHGSNPDLLTEVTYGEVGIMEKSTGRMSPVRGRTMREYEQQMGELRKENFDLKLRIYYMEEKITSKFTSEDIIKQNIELKVEMERYKKDIIDKQALLNKASETIETMTSKYSEQLEREVKNIKQECEDKVAKASQHAFEMEEQYMALAEDMKQLEEECNKELRPKLEEKEKQLRELTADLDGKDREVFDLKEKVKVLETEIVKLQDHIQHLEEEQQEEMEYLQTKLGRKDRDLQHLSFMIKERTSVEGVEALERSRYQDEVDDTKREMDKLQKNLDKKMHEVDKKNDMVAKLEDLLRAKEKLLQNIKKQFDEQSLKYTRSKEVIADYTKRFHLKEEEIKVLEGKLEQLKEENEALKQKLRDANLTRQKDAEKIQELEDQLEKLMRTLGKKEGELENFKDLLDKAQNSLTKSQEVVEDLEERLQAERCKCKDGTGAKKVNDDDNTSRLRHQLADLQIQLEEQEKRYQSKCKELDMVAQRLNIKVTTQTDSTDHSDMLQRIMGELQQLKGAVESERHLHIDINSTHTSPQKDPSSTPDLETVRPGSTHNKATIGGKNGSHIPVLTKAPCTEECESLRKQVTDLKAQVHHLQNMLKATEETVHRQTQKMKHYRNMLIEIGLLPRSRSCSVSDLPSARTTRPMTRKLSADSVAPRCRSVSPTPVRRKHVENYEEFDRLVKNNNKLKEQVEGYQRVLKVFQNRSPSPNDKLDRSGEKVSEDGDSAPMSFESAFCVLKSWFEMLDKYLVERSESQIPSSSIEVSRLRRGLAQAREAIKSMSDNAQEQDKLSEGRLSPDSGCSDNPSSAQNTLKETPSSSPTNRKSTSPRLTVTSPESMARLVHNDSHSKETYRHASGIPNIGNMSMFSQIDPTCDNTSVFSMASTKSKTTGHLNPELISPPSYSNFNVEGNNSVSQPRQLHNKHLNIDHLEQSFMPKLLDESSMADITNLGQHSLIKFEDASLLDVSSYDGQHYRTCMAEMQEQIKTLTDKYENQIRQQSRPDMDTLQQQLAELRDLRIQLEKALAWNAALEKHLIDLQKSAESTIHELRIKLEESEHNVIEKVQIIKEKEKIISETEITLDRYKDNSCKDNERVKSLEDMCSQLRNAVEQYKKRCTQLQEDNKSHMAAVLRYKTKVKDLEEDVLSEQRSKVEGLKTRVEELEREVEMRQAMELKYKDYLEQTRLQVTKLTGELDVKRAELDKGTSELYNVKMELESLRDVVEEQNQQLGDKTTLIDKLDRDMKMKDMCLNEQDTLCRDVTSKLEQLTTSNSNLSSQLDQHREACADYRRQIEEQSAITQDLRQQVDQLSDELAKSMQQRDSQDKLLQEKDNLFKETTKLNEKYLYNLKVRYKQCLTYKRELAEAKKKCEDTSVLNNTLQTELSVRQQLMENQGDMLTDDDKHRMIQQLLNELRLASIQMTKILQQNENIKQKMTELIEQKKQELNRISGDKASCRKSSESVEKLSFEDSQDDSFGSNQTWPLFDDLTDGIPRTDNLSSSLPLGSRKSASRQQEGKNPLESYLTKQTSKEVTVGSSGNQFSVPGPIYKQGITDDCLMYNVNDLPKYLQGLTQVRIDSDSRSLFAIGMIDHFEKLRKETNESNVILKGLSTRVTERLKVFNTMPALEMIKSQEYGIMKEISYAVENLRICVDSQLSLEGFFWTSELPCPNEKGEFVNQKLLDRNAALREEVSRLREMLRKSNSGQQGNEDMICERLESTLNVVSRARHNLEYKQKHRPISPHRSPSHSPRK